MDHKNIIKLVIQIRRDSEANWNLYPDIVPAIGEPCFVTDKNILKIGDGVTKFKDLQPINGVQMSADGKSIVLDDGVLKLNGFDKAEKGAQLVKGEDGTVQWIVPSTETLDGLQTTVGKLQTDVVNLQGSVKTLQNDVADLRTIVGTSETGSDTLLSRVEALEKDMDTLVTSVNDDDKINTLMELIEYINTHGTEAANMASDIKTLQQLVGTDPVADQIISAVEKSEKKAEDLYKPVKYEISHKPVGTLVDYRDKEIRVMVPANHKWEKQTVGATGNANMYYMGFKAYAPKGAVSFKEGDQGVVNNEMFDFNGDFAGTDEYGRNYSICWFALALYDEASDTWTYYGKNSTANKYIGWTYCVEWYDADGIMISADSVRINLSNESCHGNIEPYYLASTVKGVKVNGTLLDMVDGVVDVTMPKEVKGSEEITVADDGTLGIGKISFSKIVQDDDTTIIMDGGNAV